MASERNRLIEGMLAHYPFVLKNFRTYFTNIYHVGSVFDRFAIGTDHPCWYDPQDQKTVVLARGPGGAYVFALMPIPVLLVGLGMLRGLRLRRRADEVAA
jgi:hypothetical protein